MAIFKQAGTVSISFAIETSSPRLQKMIHKNLNIDRAVLVINAAVKAGIYSSGFFMIGFPTESYEEACATVEFAARSALHRATFFNPKPFAGTEIAEMAADILKNRNDAINQCDVNYYNSTFNISAMSDLDLQKVLRHAYRRFYSSPKRILRVIIRHPKFFSLPWYAVIVLIRILRSSRSNA